MRRADRLMQILLLLRGRRRTTAAQLARWLEVSPRTVYRDMADLMASGAPLNGEAGEGYWLEAGFAPPAAAFSPDELAALEAGARLLAGWADPGLAAAAQSALARIHAVLGSSGLAPEPIHAPQAGRYPRERLAPLRAAILARQGLRLDYRDAEGAASRRLFFPLGLFFWGDRWVLAGWCALRGAYRSLRVDRLRDWRPDPAPFPPGISLAAYLAASGAPEEACDRLLRADAKPWHAER
nr:WYL domain-containing protein [Chromobacterium sp. ASV5]